MKKKIMEKINIGFFGGPELSVITLEKLHQAGFLISFIVTSPDKPKGRKQTMTAPPAKEWAVMHNITVLQPEKLKDQAFAEMLTTYNADVYIVMAYGKIIPENILHIPKGKALNIHPSLLPKFRGSCPIESAILADERETGVTIIRIDSVMDHGPIVARKKVIVEPWPPTAEDLGRKLVKEGSDLLISILPDWMMGKLPETEQDHAQATFTKKIEKEDGLIDLADDPYENYLKIQAYHDWPSAFFFIERDAKKTEEKNDAKIRIKITKASYADEKLSIEKVVPEGKQEMNYEDFKRNSTS